MKLANLFGRKPPPEKPTQEGRRRAVLREDGHVEHIFIGTHNVALVKRLCATGRYLGPTDVFVTALRMLEEHEETRAARNPQRIGLPTPPPDNTRGR